MHSSRRERTAEASEETLKRETFKIYRGKQMIMNTSPAGAFPGLLYCMECLELCAPLICKFQASRQTDQWCWWSSHCSGPSRWRGGTSQHDDNLPQIAGEQSVVVASSHKNRRDQIQGLRKKKRKRQKENVSAKQNVQKQTNHYNHFVYLIRQ